jgi:hypothetical protein
MTVSQSWRLSGEAALALTLGKLGQENLGTTPNHKWTGERQNGQIQEPAILAAHNYVISSLESLLAVSTTSRQ